MLIYSFRIILLLSIIKAYSNTPTINNNGTSSELCYCDVELFTGRTSITDKVRYFCGNDLNRYNQSQQCNVDRLYLCSGANERAISIAQCPKGKRTINMCNDSLHSRNDCLRNMKCSCRGAKFKSNQMICGNNLNGSNCIPTALYRCRIIGAALPIENCSYGCLNAKCSNQIMEVSLTKDIDKRWPMKKENNSTEAISSFSSSEHEVEFITFAPLLRRSTFDP